MSKNKVAFYTENVFVGPSPATGHHFLNASGNVSSGPIIYWPDVNIDTLKPLSTTIFPGFTIDNKDNVYEVRANSNVGFHGIAQVFPVQSGLSGLYRIETDVYIPSSNPEVLSTVLTKNGGIGGFYMGHTGLDRWVTMGIQGVYGNITDGASDNFGILLTSGNNISIASYGVTGVNRIYIKNFRVIQISGNYFHNLVKQVNRVQSVNYSIDYNRQDLQNVGEQGLSESKSLNWPIVNLNISTLQHGLENENNFGLNVNFPCFFSGFNGQSFKSIDYDVTSGFNDRVLYTGISNTVRYPFKYTNSKNIFVSITDREGVENNRWIHNFSGSSMAFGNCRLNSYAVNAQINSSPTVNYGFICDNLEVNNSMIGANPALNSKNLQSSGYYILPYATGDTFPTVLNPGDITVSVSNVGYGGDVLIRDIGFDKSDWKIQGFDLNIPLERDSLTSIGYQLPLDKRIKYPLFADLGLELIVGENQEQNFDKLFYFNYPYDITISMRNKCQFNGIDSYKNTMVLYSFKGANLVSLNTQTSVNEFETVSLGFRQEINPDKKIGLNISGVVYGRNFVETGNTNLSYLRPGSFVHISGSRTFVDSFL